MPQTEPSLPHPRSRPDADVVIYDGDCKFCTSQVRNLKKLDGKDRLAFVSLHEDFIRQSFPDLSQEQMMQQMYVIPHRAPDERLGGADALRYLSRRLPWLWWLAPLMHIPGTMPIWHWLYRLVAKHRYRLAGRSGESCEDGSCDLHRFHNQN